MKDGKLYERRKILSHDSRRSANAEGALFAFCGVVGQILSASGDRKRFRCGYCLHSLARGFDIDGRGYGKRRKRTRSGGKNQGEIPENENYRRHKYAGVFLYKARKTNRRGRLLVQGSGRTADSVADGTSYEWRNRLYTAIRKFPKNLAFLLALSKTTLRICCSKRVSVPALNLP